ncbi:hypothetical protein Fmac_021121 [Flemingia macrophylla]|uniref:Uncharacterized protein n=1 Tax=Flemingia macrophylla TaxID=520843 RepID=A0ABD1LVY1_9FABA
MDSNDSSFEDELIENLLNDDYEKQYISLIIKTMKISLQNQIKERPQLPPKICKRGDLSNGYKHDCLTMSARSRPGSCRPNLGQGRYVLPLGNKVVLRRALTPPPTTTQPIGLRRLNFKPTPSRLSNMSAT